MDPRFEQFIQERKYLTNVSPAVLRVSTEVGQMSADYLQRIRLPNGRAMIGPVMSAFSGTARRFFGTPLPHILRPSKRMPSRTHGIMSAMSATHSATGMATFIIAAFPRTRCSERYSRQRLTLGTRSAML